MDILGKLPFLNSDEDAVPTIEVDEAQDKKDRIKFHRANVRNGPTNFKTQTNGQVRRARHRALDRGTKNARRDQVRNYLETRKLSAVVRTHLRLAGVLPYTTFRGDLDRKQQVTSVVWLVRRFTDGPTSFRRDDVLLALAAALKFYGQTIGDEDLQIPTDYTLPIYEIEAV